MHIETFYPHRFAGKVMIVTGSAGGIGEQTAKRAAREGAQLILVDRKEQEGEAVCLSIVQTGGKAVFLPLDLSESDAAQTMISTAVRVYGGLDIAINNAGVMGAPAPVHLLEQDALDYTMDNNFRSVFYCCRAQLRLMVEQGRGGVIVNVASIAGLTGLPGNAAYVASKHAVNGLTRNMALDYAKYGIRVNSVNPAGTDTPMVDEALTFVRASMQRAIASGADPAQAQSMAGQKTQTLQKRNAAAWEQAASILYLASAEASHITGALFATDGGWTAF